MRNKNTGNIPKTTENGKERTTRRGHIITGNELVHDVESETRRLLNKKWGRMRRNSPWGIPVTGKTNEPK